MFKFLAAPTWTTPGTGASTSLTDANSVVALVVQTLIFVACAVAFVFVIVGGIKYITSGGDEKKVASAKNTILYAIIGLVAALLAGVILNVVLSAIGINTFTF
ncbi:hypothetical protein FWG86_01430 [Candidatus Saccharibacteria bacterium]|nr:hypothetical protein [Candidatus Saccharibacteria bacterium]